MKLYDSSIEDDAVNSPLLPTIRTTDLALVNCFTP